MRSPEYSGAARRPPEPKTFEAEYFQYLAPESFTVLPPDENTPTPSPPRAPEPYKLTPRKRHKNQAFAIIAEPGSPVSSRAGSPTGRVSPFRGRGFNPAGSRHASPAPSPPPGEAPVSRLPIRISQIPVRRRSSTEDMLSPEDSPTNRQRLGSRRQPNGRSNLTINTQHSKSMSNIAPRSLLSKPPPSPRRVSNLKSSFVRLSPIIGSSPEAGSDQMQSSPSRIPRSRSQPPSRIVSPNTSRAPSRTPSRAPSRAPSRPPSRPPSRSTSRPVSRNGSRSTSREPSPTGLNRSPSKIPMRNSAYKNIPAKVDSFNRVAAASKPKVPLKPKVYSTRSSVADRSRPGSIRKNVNKSQVGAKNGSRRDPDETETTDTERETSRSNMRSSSNYSKGQDRSSRDKASSSGYYSKQQDRSRNEGASSSRTSDKSSSRVENYEKASSSGYNSKTQDKNRSESRVNGSSKHNSESYRRDDQKYENGAKNRSRRNETTTATSTTEEMSKTEDDETTEDAKDDDILSVTIDNIIGTSTTQIVSATTETVVKPLNIETKLIKQSDVQPNSHTGSQKTGTDSSTNGNQNQPMSNQNNSQTNQNTNGPRNGNNIGNSHTPANGSVVMNSNQSNNITSSGQMNHTLTNMAADNMTSAMTDAMDSMESVNNNVRHVNNSLTPSVNSLEMNVKNNLHSLTPPDSDKVNKSLMDSAHLSNSANQKLKQARTVIVDEIRPIKITVREKSGDVEVQSGNFALPRSATNGIAERPLLPPNNQAQNATDPPAGTEEAVKQGRCSKLFACCKRGKGPADGEAAADPPAAGPGGEKPPSCWDKMCCKGGSSKVADSSRFSCFPKLNRSKDADENWAERRDSILSEPPKKQALSTRLKKIFCMPCTRCRKKAPEPESVSRRTSMMSKKKSLSSTMQPPPEDTGPKLDPSLVEYSSHMRGAIPVLPVPLAWVCLMCNVFLPGFGTILSGLFCLCIGKPRFSPRDGIRPRIGAFLIDIIVGISQMFTVLFCLVGWGWSIWWGVIMLKIARKHRKIKKLEKSQIEEQPVPSVNVNHTSRDVERGA